jgi:hypothetical protein
MLPRFESGEVPRLSFRFVSESGLKRRLKIEINTHEHFAGVVGKTFAVDHRAARGSVEIPTHSLNELLATKLRAFCQRDKGRDLFGLWWSHKRDEIDPGEIVRLFLDSMSTAGRRPIRRPSSGPSSSQDTLAGSSRRSGRSSGPVSSTTRMRRSSGSRPSSSDVCGTTTARGCSPGRSPDPPAEPPRAERWP